MKPPSSSRSPGQVKSPSGAPGSGRPSEKVTTSPLTNAVLVTADGRTIVTVASGECGHDPSLQAHPYPSRVTLALVAPVSAQPNEVCPIDLVVLTVSARLPTPLGRRKLVQASSGQPIPYFDASRFARLTVLPSGCRLDNDFPGGNAGSIIARGNLLGDTRYCTYGGSGFGVPLAVTQVIGSASFNWDLGWPVVGHPMVNGHRATFRVATSFSRADIYSIIWDTDGYTFVIISQPEDVHETPVTSRQFIAIADGLRP
jgi:hypothetical protein